MWTRSHSDRRIAYLSIPLVSVLGYCLYFISQAQILLYELTVQERQEVAWAVRQLSESRKIQFVFKQQVQEWKDVLLRGYDPQLKQKYWSQFLAKEANVHGLLLQLDESLPSSDPRKLSVEKAISLHQQFGERYRSAFAMLRSNTLTAYRTADMSILGMDRQGDKVFEEIVAANLDTLGHIRNIDDSKKSMIMKSIQLRTRIGLGTIAALTLLLLLVNYMAWRRSQREIGEKDSILGRLNDALNRHSIVSITDVQGKILHVNDLFCTVSQYSREAIIGQNHRLLNSGHHSQEFFREMYRTIAQGQIWKGEVCNRAKDGSQFWTDMTIVPYFGKNGKCEQYVALRTDITARKRAEFQIERLTKLYKALSEINQSIVRIQDKETLLKTVCRISVEFGGMSLAWVGERNSKTGLIDAIESFGDTEYLQGYVAAPDSKIEIAVRENRSVIVNSFGFRIDGESPSKYSRPLAFNFNSAGAFPIRRENEVIAVLAVYHRELNAFDDEMVKLLEEMAMDVSFGLQNLEKSRLQKALQAEIRHQNDQLRTLIEAIPDAIFFKDGEGRWLVTNESAKLLFQLHGIPWEGKTELELADLHPQFRSAHEACLVDDERAWANGQITFFNEQIEDENGLIRYFDVRKVPLFTDAGERKALVILGRDITEFNRLQNSLQQSEQLKGKILDSTEEGIYGVDLDGKCTFMNRAAMEMLGYDDTEDLLGKPIHDLIHGKYTDGSERPGTEYCLHKILRTGQSVHELEDVLWRKDGQSFPVEYWSRPIFSGQEINGAVITFLDITERKQVAEKIEKLAFYDALTGLPNRRLMMGRLKHALAGSGRSGQYGALLFIDIDNFKSINDALGHLMGDLFLQQVASRLIALVRENDTVARLGGDEFVLILENLGLQEALSAASVFIVEQKVLDSINQPFLLEGKEIYSSPSIGVVLFRGNEISGEELLKRADAAMYRAKDAGRNNAQYYNVAMQTAIEEKTRIEMGLRKAIEKEQLHLYFQIQVDNMHHTIGAEGLIRWNFPELGWISPDRFIPVAEESDLIVDIGEWVLETACGQLKKWAENPRTRDLKVAINVSAKQFHRQNFVQEVMQIVKRYDIDPGKLKFELTEGIVLADVEDTILKMKEIRSAGIRISLDDFGTGYSSLSYLKKLPLDQIKIDRSFIRDVNHDRSDAILVQSIIDLSKNFELELIAEGVETEEQMSFLRQHGCQGYQGYLFGKPVAADALFAA